MGYIKIQYSKPKKCLKKYPHPPPHPLTVHLQVNICLLHHAPSGPSRTYINLPPLCPFQPSSNKLIYNAGNQHRSNLEKKCLYQINHVNSLLVLFFLSPPRSSIHVFLYAPPPSYILSIHLEQGYMLGCLCISPTFLAFRVTCVSDFVTLGL